VENCQKQIQCKDKLVVNGLCALMIVMLTAMSIVPHLKSIIGSVTEEFQSFSLGVKSALVGLIGNFLGTILVGQSVDWTCKFWLKNVYDQEMCKIYDNKMMSISLAIVGFGFRSLSAVFMLIVCYIYYREDLKKKDTSINLTNLNLT
jgi:hypothetical protein